MSNGLNVMTAAPRPGIRQWATAMTTYAALVGPEFEPDARGVARWKNGVKFLPFGCERTIGAVFDPCVARETAFTDVTDDVEVLFELFLAEVAVKCSTIAADPAALYAYAEQHSEIARSSHLAAQVERSAYTTTNPSLASEAQDLGNLDQSLIGALIAVENGLADILDGGAGMIHMPAGILAALQADGGLRYDADGRPFTATGHLIVADGGTLGVSPATGGVVAGEIWMYGSGPVFAKMDDPIRIVDDPSEGIFLAHNDWMLQVQQHGIAIFEPCSVVAALIDAGDNNIVGESSGFSTTPTVSAVEDNTATAVILAAGNTDRSALFILNDAGSSGTLYVKYGTGASSTSYTVAVAAGGYWEMPGVYTGVISGIWAADGDGTALVTEVV